MGRLLNAAEVDVEGEDPDSHRARAVRSAREAYSVARRIPTALVGEMAVRKATAQEAWIAAKANNDFARFAPELEIMVRLNKELASAIGYDGHPYDELMLQFEPEGRPHACRCSSASCAWASCPCCNALLRRPRRMPRSWTCTYAADNERVFGLEAGAGVRHRSSAWASGCVAPPVRDLLYAPGCAHDHPLPGEFPARRPLWHLS